MADDLPRTNEDAAHLLRAFSDEIDHLLQLVHRREPQRARKTLGDLKQRMRRELSRGQERPEDRTRATHHYLQALEEVLSRITIRSGSRPDATWTTELVDAQMTLVWYRDHLRS